MAENDTQQNTTPPAAAQQEAPPPAVVTHEDELPIQAANQIYLAQDAARRDQVTKLQQSVSRAIGAAFSPKGSYKRA